MTSISNENFQHILRLWNTNVNGKDKIAIAITKIKGMGRRYAYVVCKKADIDINKRNNRGLRYYWGLRVRGQHTKTTGRRGKTVGVSKKR